MGIEDPKSPMAQVLADACKPAEDSSNKDKALLMIGSRIEKAMQLGAYKRIIQMLSDGREAGFDMEKTEDEVLLEIATRMMKAWKSDHKEAKQILQSAKEAGFDPKELERICQELRK